MINILRIKNIPLECPISSVKKFKFNLNQYRNAHYQVLNKAKKWFTTWLLLRVKKAQQIDQPVAIHYRFWLRKRTDLMNVGAVVDKFLQDALVSRRVIPDDNVDYVKQVTFEFAGYDKNPHGEAEIRVFYK